MDLRAAAPAVAGLIIGGGLGATALLRRDRALHTLGWSRRGVLTVTGGAGSGVALLDEAARRDVAVRFSRGGSFTRTGLDVMGLALRVPGAADGGRDADVLFSSTGLGRVTRHVLALRRLPSDGPMTTLLPMRAPVGDVLLAAEPAGEHAWTMSWAVAGGPWRPFAELELGGEVDDPGRFDPVGSAPAGLVVPRWVRLLRDPAYRASRLLAPRADGDRRSRR